MKAKIKKPLKIIQNILNVFSFPFSSKVFPVGETVGNPWWMNRNQIQLQRFYFHFHRNISTFENEMKWNEIYLNTHTVVYAYVYK